MTSMDDFYNKIEADINSLNKRKIEAGQFMELLTKCPGCNNHVEFSLGGACPICMMRVHIDSNNQAHSIDSTVFEV